MNLHTITDSFQTPNIADVLQTFAGRNCFSTLDASQAYMNIPVKENCQSMTAFVCCFGLFGFLRMPFGLRNAGAAYCRLVQAVVDEINDPGISAYLDDVIPHTGDPDARPLESDPSSTLPGSYQTQSQENHSVRSSCRLSLDSKWTKVE